MPQSQQKSDERCHTCIRCGDIFEEEELVDGLCATCEEYICQGME